MINSPVPEDEPDVSVMIVAYNSADFIRECIDSVYAWTRDCRFEILLIDNGTDGTAALVAEHYPEIRIVTSEGNIGFGAGNNRLAANARGARLLVLNPDTVLTTPAIDTLVAFARTRPEAGAWGGQTLSLDGHPDTGNNLVIPRLGIFARLAFGDSSGMLSGGIPRGTADPARVDVLCGAFMMVRRDVWQRLGGFDESFFLYSEEIDLFARMKAAGLDVWMTPNSAVVHDAGSGAALSPARTLYKTTGQMHFAYKHWGNIGGSAAAVLLWIYAVQRWTIGAALGWRSPRLASMRRAYGPLVIAPWRWWAGYRRLTGA